MPAIRKVRANMKCKLLVLCFLSFFIISQLTSPTTATFNDIEQINFHLPFEDSFNEQQIEERDKEEPDEVNLDNNVDEDQDDGATNE